MNWKRIIIYGACLSAVQIGAGFAAGLFRTASVFSAWDVASLVLCTFLFAKLAIRDRPLAHACLVLAFYAVISIVMAAFTTRFLSGVPATLIALEWLGIIFSMAIGLSIGRALLQAPGIKREA